MWAMASVLHEFYNCLCEFLSAHWIRVGRAGLHAVRFMFFLSCLCWIVGSSNQKGNVHSGFVKTQLKKEYENSFQSWLQQTSNCVGLFFHYYFKICLKGRVTGIEKERQRSFHWFTLQMAATARSGSGWSRNPGRAFRSAFWITGAQINGLSSAVFPIALAGSCIRSRTAGTQTGTLIQYSKVAVCSHLLWCNATP